MGIFRCYSDSCLVLVMDFMEVWIYYSPMEEFMSKMEKQIIAYHTESHCQDKSSPVRKILNGKWIFNIKAINPEKHQDKCWQGNKSIERNK